MMMMFQAQFKINNTDPGDLYMLLHILQSSRKTFLATSPVGLVTDQAH